MLLTWIEAVTFYFALPASFAGYRRSFAHNPSRRKHIGIGAPNRYWYFRILAHHAPHKTKDCYGIVFKKKFDSISDLRDHNATDRMDLVRGPR